MVHPGDHGNIFRRRMPAVAFWKTVMSRQLCGRVEMFAMMFRVALLSLVMESDSALLASLRSCVGVALFV